MPRDAASRHVALQLVRSGTSSGANYEEARGAESRADFAHKAAVAAKEMREACFWLNLVHRASLVPDDSNELLQSTLREAHELAAILGASARTARSHPE